MKLTWQYEDALERAQRNAGKKVPAEVVTLWLLIAAEWGHTWAQCCADLAPNDGYWYVDLPAAVPSLISWGTRQAIEGLYQRFGGEPISAEEILEALEAAVDNFGDGQGIGSPAITDRAAMWQHKTCGGRHTLSLSNPYCGLWRVELSTHSSAGKVATATATFEQQFGEWKFSHEDVEGGSEAFQSAQAWAKTLLEAWCDGAVLFCEAQLSR